jgi:C4-dicarboxylate-specific signal transduction histidine kinase
VNIVSEDTLVAVPDTGSGLRQDDLGRLFEPFYAMKRDGLGMGLPDLPLDYRGARGWLWAIPNEPRGAAFQFTLPP